MFPSKTPAIPVQSPGEVGDQGMSIGTGEQLPGSELRSPYDW